MGFITDDNDNYNEDNNSLLDSDSESGSESGAKRKKKPSNQKACLLYFYRRICSWEHNFYYCEFLCACLLRFVIKYVLVG